MKSLIVVLTLVISSFAFADDAAKAERFEKRKAQVLENIGKRQANLDTFKSCVSSASSKDALKSCRKAHKAKNQELKAMRKEAKEKRKADRKARKEARKNSDM